MSERCWYCSLELPEVGLDVIVEYIDPLLAAPVPSCQDCRIERDLTYFREHAPRRTA